MARKRSKRNMKRKKISRRKLRGGTNKENLDNYLNTLQSDDSLRERVLRACAIMRYMVDLPPDGFEDDLLQIREVHDITDDDIYNKNLELDVTGDENRFVLYNEEAKGLVRAYMGQLQV